MNYSLLITIAQIVVSMILIVLVLIQERSAGMSGLFGGDGGGIYQTRRGLERIAFGSTVVFVIIFAVLSIAQLVLR